MRVFYLSPSLNIIARTAKLTDAADKYGVAEKNLPQVHSCVLHRSDYSTTNI